MKDARNPGAVVHDDSVPATREWIGLARRRWATILGCTVGVPLLLVALTLILVTPQYDATATILVLPPEFSSALRPEPIGVEGYRTLLESDAVVGAAARELAAQGHLEAADVQGLREHLSSNIFTNTRGQAQVLAPLIEVHVRATSAEQAEVIAETWVDAFFTASNTMMADRLDETIALVNAQYEQKRAEIAKLETERDHVAADFLEQINSAEHAWDERLARVEAEAERELAEFTADTESLVAAYQTETRNLVRTADEDSGVVAVSPPSGAGAASPGLAVRWRQLVALRIQLAQTQQFVSLARAITDEALWEAQVSGAVGGDFPQGIVDQRLVSQELNPAYTELALQLAEVEIGLEAVDLGAERRAVVRRAAQRLEALQRERSAGLTTMLAMRDAEARRLRAQRAVMIRAETRNRRAALDDLMSERDRALDALTRDIEQATERSQQLAEPYEQAQLASSESDGADVTLAAGVSSSLGRPPRFAIPALAGLFLGLVIGLLGALVMDTR